MLNIIRGVPNKAVEKKKKKNLLQQLVDNFFCVTSVLVSRTM